MHSTKVYFLKRYKKVFRSKYKKKRGQKDTRMTVRRSIVGLSVLRTKIVCHGKMFRFGDIISLKYNSRMSLLQAEVFHL